jgi:flagellar protein FlbD
MIEVTRLGGKIFYVNPHLIEAIETNPDTTLIMVSGKRLVIQEDYQAVFDSIVKYRKRIGTFGNEE